MSILTFFCLYFFQIQVTNHDGLLTNTGSNYLHTSLHLEDVYSVISKDTEHISTHKHVTSPLVIDSSYATTGSSTSPIVIDSSFVSTCDKSSPLSSPPSSTSGSDVTPLPSPEDVSTGCGYQYSLERATPSPNKDSGIESDNSPVTGYTSEDVKKVRQLKVHKRYMNKTNMIYLTSLQVSNLIANEIETLLHKKRLEQHLMPSGHSSVSSCTC